MTYQVTAQLKVKAKDGTVRDLGPGDRVNLPDHLAERLLREGRVKPLPMPTLDDQRYLERIPFQADPRFFYWQEGGQSIVETEKELKKFLH